MNILNILKKAEIYFLVTLLTLNCYLAVALRGDNFVDSTHLMMAVVMLIFINDKLFKQIEKK